MLSRAGAADAAVLTNIAQVVGLKRAAASAGVPVRLSAVVTYADLTWSLLYLQDETGTLFVLPKGITNEPAPGDLVEATGITGWTDQGLTLEQCRLRPLGRRPLPQPVAVGDLELLSGRFASRWVEVEAVVRKAGPEGERARLDLMNGMTRLESYVRRGPADASDLNALVMARVRVRGVCSVQFKDNRIVGAGLMIPDMSYVTVLKQPATPLADYPVLPIARVLKTETTGEKAGFVRVQGVVVAQRNPALTLRDDSGAITVVALGQKAVSLYDRLDVWGVPALDQKEIILEDASYKPATAPGVAARGPTSRTNSLPVLRTVRQVRGLNREQALLRPPVQLKGVITYADASWQQFFLQDDSGAIYVQAWQDGLRAGDLVEVEGVADPGMVARMIVNATIREVGQTNLPAPARFELKELLSISKDCAWVELEGVVRSAEDSEIRHARLQLVNRDGPFEIVIQGVGGSSAFRHLVDAEIRVRGVNTVSIDDRGRFTSLELRVPDAESLEVLVAAPADPFALEPRPIGAIREAKTALLGLQRIRILGVVTLITSDGAWCVQDSTGALLVRPSQTNQIQIGEGVDVAGFPDVAGTATELAQALFRPGSQTNVVAPLAIRPEDILPQGRYHRELVVMEGRLLADAGGSMLPSLLVQSGTVVFPAQFETGSRKIECPVWRAGSLVRLTGVCTVQFNEHNAPRSFLLLLRRPDDVVVLQEPPWWTLAHTATLGGGLVLVVMAVLGWVQLLRRQVRQQTQQIRQRLEAEAALEKHFMLVWETSADGMRMTDGQGLTVKVNLAYCRLVERSRAELEGQPLAEAYQESDRVRITAHYRELFTGGKIPPSQEHQVVLWNGRKAWFELTNSFLEQPGGPTLLLSQFRDVTARKGAEAERERLMQAIEQAAETIIITDARGTIQYVNPTFATITGYTRAEAIGQTPRMLKSGRQDAAFYKEMWDTLTRGETWTGRFINRKKDGTFYTEDATISPVRDASGQTVNYVAAKRDITREIKLEDQLIQAQKMESVGRLAGGVAHDFNNMLGVILGQAELAMEQVDPSQPLHADLMEIRQAALRSADLTRQLLTFARKQTVAPKVLDLNETVDGMLRMLCRLIGEDIKLVWRPARDLRPVKVDPAQIDQILANLCVNARDAIAGVGQVTIETSNSKVDEAYCAEHSGVEPGDYVLIAVTDTGCGMSKEVQQHLFEPFFSTKGVGKGTGLGLASVYGAVKQNQGFIHVQSEPGCGTTFRIYLPVHQGADPDKETMAPAGIASGGPETILLVEDEPSILKLGQRLLEAQGYQVLAANCPAEAIRLAGLSAGKIDLLMTDVVMPGMNGRDLARQLQSVQPSLKSLFMSGYTADVIAHHGVLDGGVHFVQKPFSREELAAKVREALDSPAAGEAV